MLGLGGSEAKGRRRSDGWRSQKSEVLGEAKRLVSWMVLERLRMRA